MAFGSEAFLQCYKDQVVVYLCISRDQYEACFEAYSNNFQQSVINCVCSGRRLGFVWIVSKKVVHNQ